MLLSALRTNLFKVFFLQHSFQDTTVKSCLEKLWKYPNIIYKLLILYQGLKEIQWLFVSLNMCILQDQIVYLKVSKVSLIIGINLLFILMKCQFLTQSHLALPKHIVTYSGDGT